jgi:hypothetical protein
MTNYSLTDAEMDSIISDIELNQEQTEAIKASIEGYILEAMDEPLGLSSVIMKFENPANPNDILSDTMLGIIKTDLLAIAEKRLLKLRFLALETQKQLLSGKHESEIDEYELFMYFWTRAYDQVNDAIESLSNNYWRALDLAFYREIQYRINKIGGLVEPYLEKL